MLADDKHTSLLSIFVSYQKYQVLQIQLQGNIFTTLSWSVLKGPNVLVLHYTRLEKLDMDKHTTLLHVFVIYQENEMLRIQLQVTNPS